VANTYRLVACEQPRTDLEGEVGGMLSTSEERFSDEADRIQTRDPQPEIPVLAETHVLELADGIEALLADYHAGGLDEVPHQKALEDHFGLDIRCNP
jgi:hypothetical protein